MLVHKLAVLRCPLASTMGMKKQVALTMALCKLHNDCIGPDLSPAHCVLDDSIEDEFRVLESGGV